MDYKQEEVETNTNDAERTTECINIDKSFDPCDINDVIQDEEIDLNFFAFAIDNCWEDLAYSAFILQSNETQSQIIAFLDEYYNVENFHYILFIIKYTDKNLSAKNIESIDICIENLIEYHCFKAYLLNHFEYFQRLQESSQISIFNYTFQEQEPFCRAICIEIIRILPYETIQLQLREFNWDDFFDSIEAFPKYEVLFRSELQALYYSQIPAIGKMQRIYLHYISIWKSDDTENESSKYKYKLALVIYMLQLLNHEHLFRYENFLDIFCETHDLCREYDQIAINDFDAVYEYDLILQKIIDEMVASKLIEIK